MPLSFRLTTIFYVMALLGAALTAFGAWGSLVAAIVLAVWFVVKAQDMPGVFGLIMLGLLWLASALIVSPLLQSARTPDIRNECRAHLRDIAIALENYHATYGSFPPLYIADANGKPMHSWRVLILPFMESQALYNAYSFSEPWNGPNNRKLADQAPFYCCPGIPGDELVGCTTYFAVVGKDAAWVPDRARTISEITDDPSHSILVLESSAKEVNWMEPVDLSIDEALHQLISASSGGHRKGHTSEAVFANGNVDTVWSYERPDTAKALLTINAGDEIEKSDVYRRDELYAIYEKQSKQFWLIPIATCIFIALAILPAFRLNRLRSRTPARRSSPS